MKDVSARPLREMRDLETMARYLGRKDLGFVLAEGAGESVEVGEVLEPGVLSVSHSNF